MELSDAVVVAKSSRLKSVVWNDFDRVKKGDTFVAVCRHCKRKLCGSSSSGTSHLRNHLIRCKRISNHGIAEYFSGRENKNNGAVTLATVKIDPEQTEDEPQPQPIAILDHNYQQGQMGDYAVTVASSNLDQRQSQYDIARMVILHGYPLDMVDHVGFRIFVKNLQPWFELQAHDRVEADCIEIYVKEREKVYRELQKLQGKVSLVAEMWVTSDDAEYLCLTAQYIDEEWQVKKKVLNFYITDPTQTKDWHSEVIMTCLMDWDIDCKLLSMTFDSYSANDNVVCRIRECLSQNGALYCNGLLFDTRRATDLINVMALDACDALFEITHKIRESIRYVKSSQVIQGKFREMAVQAGVQCQKFLCFDNTLRWDSTYFMLEVALEYRAAFALLQEQDPAFLMCPSDLEWEKATAVISCLKLFVEVTDSFMNYECPTANLYFPDICEIHLQLIEWCKNSDDFVSSVAAKMKSKFDEYWDKCNLALAVAAVLDPRFKMKLIEYYYAQLFGTGSAELIDEVFEHIKALYRDHSVSSQGLASQVCKRVHGFGMDSRDRLMGFDKFLHETSQSGISNTDLDKYLEEPLFPRTVDFNILNWWKIHTSGYPILSMMARNILGIPLSNVGSEFAFHNRRRELHCNWSKLQPSTVQALMCSQDWIKNEFEC